MPSRLLSPTDLDHLMKGASVLGTGGGGSYTRARAIVSELAHRRLQLTPLAELPPEALGVTAFIAGGGLTHDDVERLTALAEVTPALGAARALEAALGRPIGFVYAAEIGPQNTLEPARLAALLGVPLVDGDCAGRSVPELNLFTLALAGIPMPPFSVATFQGDALVVTTVAQPERAEAMVRALASASGGIVCVTGFPVTAKVLRGALIPGTLSRAMQLGSHTGPGRHPAQALAAATPGGRLAFRGRVAAAAIRKEGGFFRGTVDLEGTDGFQGRRYRLGVQNEFMWSWEDDRLDIQCPDLICVVDWDSGTGKLTYGNGFEQSVEVGDEVAVLRFPCPDIWDSPEGRARFPQPPAVP